MTIPGELMAFCGGVVFGAGGLVLLMWMLVAWQRKRQ